MISAATLQRGDLCGGPGADLRVNTTFRREVSDRFGVLPNFFCSADAAPGLIEELWKFARSAYLDSPLPSLFKERLFVHLSRFCRVRYCIVRHVGFLTGHGRPAGDAGAPLDTVNHVIELLRRPVPEESALSASLARLERMPPGSPLPEARSEFEGDLFDALTVIFLWPPAANRARTAVRAAVGDATFEQLIAYLAFIRTAHYWTETHPHLEYEADVQALLGGHAELAALLLDTSEAELIEGGLKLRETLQILERARVDLRESEQQFRSFVTAASDVLYKMSADWQEMHLLHGKGFLIDTSTPRSSWLDTYIPDSDKPLVQTTIAEAIRTKGMFQLEHRVIRADGTIGWTSSRAVPFLDERGNIVEWLGAASDITERKRAEEVLRTSEEELREADRRKDEFLAMLAHELRNPLAPIRTGLELIRVAGNTAAAVERVRGMMDRQVGHMVRLIDDLLDVSRITSGKIQLQREPTPLNSLVSSAIDANRAAMTAKNIEFTIVLPEQLCVLDVDPTRFVQVVSNLLHNATKFTEDGGTIRLSGHLSDGDSHLPRQLTLSVLDSGVGISREFLSRVFELFSQGAGESSHAGLGIGLALAQRLVDMHGGAIEVRSEGPGRGSEFVVRMPLSTRPPHVRAEEALDSTGIDCRVVVIDDNRDAAELMAMLVQELGGECKAAYDGESGLREVLTDRPDVVLLDIGMPGLVSRLRDSLTKSRQLGKDLVSRFGPYEGCRCFVGDREVLANGGLEGAHAPMGAALDLLLAQQGEPPFDQVEPGGAGGREVDVEPWMADEPSPYAGRFVGAVVIQDQVDVEVRGDARVDRLQELQELLTAMPAMTFTDDLARGDIERREQRRRAMAPIVVRPPFGRAERHRQDRCGAIQRLDLTLFVDAQHQRAVRRREIEAHDVPHFVDEQGITRELERLAAMRLQPEGAPDAADRGVTQLQLLGQCAGAPVRGIPGLLLQRVRDHLLHLPIGDAPRRARSRLVHQTVQPLLDEAPPPAAHRLPRDPQFGGNLRIRSTRGARPGRSPRAAPGPVRSSGDVPTAPVSSARSG